MDFVAEDEVIEAARGVTRMWWLFLITGIAWVLIAFMVLSFKPTTPATIGYLTGFVLIAAGVNELMAMGFVSAWRWLRAVLGVLYIIAGFMSLASPFQTFGILALLIGWYLLFKGIFDIILSVVERHLLPLWGLGLASGIIEVAIAMWALGYPGRSAWLLVLWIGITALMRGVTEIVLSFKLHGAQAALA